MKKLSLFLIICFSSVLVINAQTAKYSNEFLSLGIGARGLAMGNTMTAVSNDVTAAYWNPANLSKMEQKYQLSLMHAEYFASIAKYDYAGIAYKIDNRSTVAFTYIRFGVDDIMNTTELIDNQGNIDYNRISYFSAADNAFILSYAHNFEKAKGLSIGANAKVIRRRIGKFAGSWGFGLDAGLGYNIKDWHIGVMVRDVTSTFNAWRYTLDDHTREIFEQTGNEIPKNSTEITVPGLNIGGARYVEMGKGFNGTFAIDLNCYFDGKRNMLVSSKGFNLDPHVGVEFAYKKIVALRAGVSTWQFEQDFDKKKVTCQLNLGIGIGIKNIVFIDYTFTNLGNFSIAKYSHIFSLKVALNTFKKNKN